MTDELGGEHVNVDDAEWELDVDCPYCGERGTVVVDPLGGSNQQYVQDCEVCCRPWDVTVRVHAGGAHVELKQEDA